MCVLHVYISTWTEAPCKQTPLAQALALIASQHSKQTHVESMMNTNPRVVYQTLKQALLIPQTDIWRRRAEKNTQTVENETNEKKTTDFDYEINNTRTFCRDLYSKLGESKVIGYRKSSETRVCFSDFLSWSARWLVWPHSESCSLAPKRLFCLWSALWRASHWKSKFKKSESEDCEASRDRIRFKTVESITNHFCTLDSWRKKRNQEFLSFIFILKISIN